MIGWVLTGGLIRNRAAPQKPSPTDAAEDVVRSCFREMRLSGSTTTDRRSRRSTYCAEPKEPGHHGHWPAEALGKVAAPIRCPGAAGAARAEVLANQERADGSEPSCGRRIREQVRAGLRRGRVVDRGDRESMSATAAFATPSVRTATSAARRRDCGTCLAPLSEVVRLLAS